MTVHGNVYVADLAYTAGAFGHVGGEVWTETSGNLGGISYEERHLYWCGRRDFIAYRFDVPPGDYIISIGFNEMEFHGPDFRRFDVVIEGQTVLTEFDIADHVGRYYAVIHQWLVTTTDGTLDITAPAALDSPDVCTIGVMSAIPDQEAPPAPSNLVVRGSYGRVLLDWDASLVADRAGYLVYRLVPGRGFEPLTPEPIPVYRYLDEDVVVGEVNHYQVTTVDLFGNESQPGLGSGAAIPIDSSSLKTLGLTISEANLHLLNSNVWSDEYVPAVFEIDDLVIDAGVRYRGSSARLMPKKNYKIRVPQIIAGRRRFNVNSEFGDDLLIRNKLGFDFFSGYTPVPLVDLIHLRLNGHFAGVFTEVENMDEHFLARVGLDEDSNLYKAGRGTRAHLGLLYPQSEYVTTYEKKTGSGGHEDLIEFIEFINLSSLETFEDWLGYYLEVDEVLDYYTIIIDISKNGFCCNNYYLYHDLGSGKWQVLPWDNSRIIFTAQYPLDFGTEASPTGEGFNRLFNRMMMVPAFRYAHAQRLLRHFDTRLNHAFAQPLVQVYHDTLAFDVERDFWKYDREDASAFHTMVDHLETFVDERRAFIELNVYEHMPSPALTGVLFINEVMADNVSTIADEAGDFDDWIEIYNRSSATFYLERMYLTDDLAMPMKWAFPDTSIAPGGFLLVWADGEPEEGPLHTNFRLSGSGEDVGLYDIVENGNGRIDDLSFPALGEDVSYGRHPDGGALMILETPTPGSSNVRAPNQPPYIGDVAWTPESPAATDTVTVTCRILDDHTIEEATLWMTDAGGPWLSVPLADDGQHGDGEANDDIYGAFIHGQEQGNLVRFYLQAVDDSSATTLQPPGAPGEYFAYLVGYVPPALYLNELLASNDTVIADEQGDFDDWFEIYNGSGAIIDLSGMYVSDNLDNHTKWAIPDTTLPPYAFLLIWADDEPWEGTWHTNFKLDADGEELGIYDSPATGWARIDSVSWGPQTTDISLGRIPDGAPIWHYFNEPSPGNPNSTPAVVAAAPASGPHMQLGPTLANPVHRRATIPFSLGESSRVVLNLYDVRGALVRRLLTGEFNAGDYRIEWDGRDTRGERVASGVYFIELRSGSGGTCLRSRLVLLH